MIISVLLMTKIIITIIFVLILLLLAEKISPKFSGIISGIPTGTAIILFFYALEQGNEFVLESSRFNLIGMIGIHIFIYLYFIISMKFSQKNDLSNIFFSSLVGIIGYFLTIYFLKKFEYSLLSAMIISLASILFFNYLFKKIKDSKITNNFRHSPKIIFIRVVIASLAIIIVTSLAEFVGPQWAGLLSAFPTTILPLIVIVHSSYGKEHAHTIIKNIPKGQIAVIIYVLSIIFFYPRLGVYLGTLASYLLVLIYLLFLFRYLKD